MTHSNAHARPLTYK